MDENPNHESLFDRHLFSRSAGVANIQHETARLNHLTTDITAQEEGEGFGQISQLLVEFSSLKG